MKKVLIFLIIIILLAIIIGGYFWRQKFRSEIFNLLSQLPELLDIDLSLSPLGAAALPDLDMDIDFDLSGMDFSMDLGNGFFDLNFGGSTDIQDPAISEGGININGFNLGGLGNSGAAPPAGYQSDAKTCAMFDSAPSCSFVPEQYREMCEKCKK